MKPQLQDKIIVSIERLGIYGEGVGSCDGFTVFVEGALPGEVVEARVIEVRKNFARAQVVRSIQKSPYRVVPPCPVFGTCGGCQIMHLEYGQQLEVKRARVKDALQRIGKIQADVQPCVPSPSPLSYRNKIQLPYKDGHLGLYSFNSHDLVVIDKCYIHCPLGEKAFQCVREIIKSESDIRHVLIKTAVRTGQVLITLVTRGEVDLTPLALEIKSAMPEIKGVVQNINNEPGNIILGRVNKTLAGEPFIHDTICGLTFKVSPASFFQVNPMQAEHLYKKAVELCSLTGTETVLDAYCGVGTLSLLLALRAKKVIGIESVKDAIADAQENAKLNKIENATFICGLAENSEVPDIDVAVINPPRKGCDPAFLAKLTSLKPSKIVYISCDPATLARDLSILKEHYNITYVQPFDMFPQTVHVETLVLLELINHGLN